MGNRRSESRSQRLEIVQEVKIVQVVLSVLLCQGDVVADVGGAQAHAFRERLAHLDERRLVRGPKPSRDRVEVGLHAGDLDSVEFGAALVERSIQALQLAGDGLVKPTREDLVQAILHSNKSIDVCSAVYMCEEVTETISLADLLGQILNLNDLACYNFHARLRCVRVARRHLFRFLVFYLVHLSDESLTFSAVIHVRVNLGQSFGHLVAQILGVLQRLL